jgi:uncharacterized membrane protein
MKSALLYLRNASYHVSKRMAGENWTDYSFLVILAIPLLTYYIVFWVLLAGVLNRIAYRLPEIIRYNYFIQLVLDMSIFILPIYFLTKKMIGWLQSEPYEEEVSSSRLRLFTVFYVLVVFIGFALVPGVAIGMDSIWPPNDLKMSW